ncbi:hypothetical protein [Paenibacillus sp. OSY-SE]|uniref:hypothetical protein n=1 Tax=Paenibacillus sp. OSY-SE TaxID=1196323 RepID=UPI0003108599|nr:hypothetical protein [Paenibacillus sp. OSY-SE]
MKLTQKRVDWARDKMKELRRVCEEREYDVEVALAVEFSDKLNDYLQEAWKEVERLTKRMVYNQGQAVKAWSEVEELREKLQDALTANCENPLRESYEPHTVRGEGIMSYTREQLEQMRDEEIRKMACVLAWTESNIFDPLSYWQDASILWDAALQHDPEEYVRNLFRVYYETDDGDMSRVGEDIIAELFQATRRKRAIAAILTLQQGGTGEWALKLIINA